MKNNHFIIFTLAIFGILSYFYFYHQISPRAGIHLEISKNQIEQMAFETITKLDYDVSTHRSSINFDQDKAQIKYLYQQFGSAKAIELMRNQIPVYHWKINWSIPKDILKRLKSSKNDEVNITVGTDNTKQAIGDLDLTLSTAGKILKFNATIEKITHKDTIDQQHSLTIAEQLFQQIEGEEYLKYRIQSQEKDTTAIFKWIREEALFGEKLTVEIQTYDARLIKYEKKFSPPSEVLSDSARMNLLHIPRIFVFLIFFITIVIVLVQKLRRDEISFKSGIGISLLAGLATAISIIISSYQESILDIVIPIIFGPVFVSFFMLAVVGAGESLGREIWSEKLITFDALNKYKILFAKLSMNIFNGIALAFLSLGIMAVIGKLSSLHPAFYYHIGESDPSPYVLVLPLLYVLTSSLIDSSFSEFIFRLFSISFLRKKLSRKFWIMIISAILWTFSFIGDSETISIPIYLHLIKNFTIGILFAYFFLKFDLMTVLIGSILFRAIAGCYPMLFWGDTAILLNGIILWVLICILVVIAILGLKRRIDEPQLLSYVPPYVLRMQERERIKRELEIARKVQLSFLPGEVPKIQGLDIATICIPANEVGGDYFDFIRLDERRLGIVIGDVSGKGIPAAFHMTLTKGFLKSQVKVSSSPRDVLIRLNELFYENVARGTFISMIYGIFDVNQKILTFARAGHNPLIIRSGSQHDIELLCPKGIALGLEKGKIFNQFIEEKQVSIHQNDLFIFYTDGVSEAMDKEKKEFGEERLQAIVRNNSHLIAIELIQIIQQQIHEFVGNTPQHDDMTMIVVNVL